MLASWLLAGSLLSGPGQAPPPADSTDTPHRTLEVGLRYESDYTYFGRSQAGALPFAATTLTYTTKDGLYASAELYSLLGTKAALDETDLTLGWDHNLGKTLDVSLSYSRYFFPSGSELVKSSVNNSFDAALGQDWKVLYTQLSATYLFGKGIGRGDAFLVLENSRSFEIPHVLGARNFLTFEPLLSLAAGTQSFAEASLTRRSGRKSSLVRRFGLVDYEVSVPLTYTVGKVALAAGWRYVRPVNLPADDVDSRALSVWTAGVTLSL